jgi:uncharacterized protein GlcG (DUF336 family)
VKSHVKTIIIAIASSVVLGFALVHMPRQAEAGPGGGDNAHSGPPTESPRPGLTRQDIGAILDHAETTANAVDSGLRKVGGVTQKTRMHIAIVDRDGVLLAVRSMSDAWVGSYDIAIAKARTAAFFSSDENALTSRVIGALSQPGGDLWEIGNSNQTGVSGGPNTRNGLVCFPGGVPLYKNGKLIGGIGVSGDGVEQDEAVAFGGATGFPPVNIGAIGFPP